MNKFMGEKWLLDEIIKDKNWCTDFSTWKAALQVNFEKVTTSKIAVTSFIKSKRLAESILTNASIRKKLWEDKALRLRLTNELGSFENSGDFEKLIAERVKSYSP